MMDTTHLRVARILMTGAREAYGVDDREDWPVHRPIAPEAPIPGRHWYGGCNPDRPLVRPDGLCEDCGETACAECGAGFYPDGGCQCQR